MQNVKYSGRLLLLTVLLVLLAVNGAGAQETGKYTAEQWVEQGKVWLNDPTRQDISLYAFNRAIALDPNYAEAYLSRGKVQWLRGQKEQALADYDETLRLDGKNGEAYYRRAILNAERGKIEAALEDVNKAIALYPTYQDVYLLRAYLNLYKQDRYQQAVDDYTRLVAMRPDDAQIYADRAMAYNKLQNNELALVDINKAIALKPQEVHLYYSRSHIYGCLGRYKESAADSRFCLEKWQNNGSVCFNLAQALELSGDQDEAIKYYELSLKNTGLMDDQCLAKIIARIRGDWEFSREWL
ncbi:MAG TPA: tetratricopeptide repeat protein [Patescibacteria group bacterium]|nr:tetratricopeptide repeat protein [Patescibacteria group bacterium]